MPQQETNITNLRLNYLSKEQYELEKAAGRLDQNQIYMTPAEDIEVPTKVSDLTNDLGFVVGTSINTTLLAANWSNNQQTVAVTGMTTTANGNVGLASNATSAQIIAASNASLGVLAQSTNNLTIIANGVVPTIDIPIVAVIYK